MKKIYLLTTALLIISNITWADTHIFQGTTAFLPPIPSYPWILNHKGEIQSNVCKTLKPYNLNITVTTLLTNTNGQNLSGINITCDGINGVTHMHLDAGMTNSQCTIQCNLNNGRGPNDYMQFRSDNTTPYGAAGTSAGTYIKRGN